MKLLPLIVLLAIAVGAPGVVGAEEVTLMWDANTEPDIGGYKIYYNSRSSGEPYNGVGILIDGIAQQSPVDVGNVTEVTMDLPMGFRYYFVVTAYDTEEPVLESDYSNEVDKGLIKHPKPANVRWK